MPPFADLPEPSAEALAASRALAERIASRIARAGGWIGFDAFMAQALYEPGLGYYAGGSRKFGAAGDFVTAPELSDLFGACLARQCAQWFEHCPARVIEFGAGSGAMAVQVLRELERLGVREVAYDIVEVSGELAARQAERIRAECAWALPRVRWLPAWPDQLDGVVLGNEVLDAMPVRAFRIDGGRVFERGVVVTEPREPGGAPGFAWSLREADPPFAARVRERLAEGHGMAPAVPGPYDGEIGEQAEAWVRQLGSRLVRGAALLIDYGFPRREFFHAQRTGGTLMCHHRHRAHTDPFLLPGLQDITAHVDFTAIAQAAEASGLRTLGYVPQSRLLTNLGLADDLIARHRDAAGDPLAWARQAQAAQALLSEAEMGELFKAIALASPPLDEGLGFERGDRLASLGLGRAVVPPEAVR